MLLHVLIASQRQSTAQRIAHLMAGEDVLVTVLAEKEELEGRLRRSTCDLLLLDETMADRPDGFAVSGMRNLPHPPEVVVLSWSDDPLQATGMLAEEVLAVVHPSARKEELTEALRAILDRLRAQRHQELIIEEADEGPRLANYVTRSSSMQELLRLVSRVVQAQSTLLVLGETGVGKEHLSRAIHQEGPRASGPFVAVSCAALAEGLLESELFGHVAGAFTGAVRSRRGYFELAHQGTLFLDEIGEMSAAVQVKLLRFLQDKRIQPVGSEEEIGLDVRLITATNRDLPSEMARGRFRSDLYYRLSVVTLPIPPLRARREDIPALVDAYVRRFEFLLQRNVTEVSAEALALLTAYDWPGNIRELANVIERAVLLCDGDRITPADLPAETRTRAGGISDSAASSLEPTSVGFSNRLLEEPFLEARRRVLETFERSYVEQALSRCHGRIKDAAALSGINVRTLYEKMQRLGISKESFRIPPREG